MMMVMPLLYRLVALLPSNVALLVLTVSSGSALYNAHQQPWTALFVASAYLNCLALFMCARLLDGVPREDVHRRRKLELAVLLLAVTLNATFCYQVSKLMPPVMSALLWFSAALVSVGGCLLFYRGGAGRRRAGGVAQ